MFWNRWFQIQKEGEIRAGELIQRFVAAKMGERLTERNCAEFCGASNERKEKATETASKTQQNEPQSFEHFQTFSKEKTVENRGYHRMALGRLEIRKGEPTNGNM